MSMDRQKYHMLQSMNLLSWQLHLKEGAHEADKNKVWPVLNDLLKEPAYAYISLLDRMRNVRVAI